MTNAYLLLAVAIVSEVFGSSMLKLSDGFKRRMPSLGVVLGMGAAFYCLSLALAVIPLGTAYAIWSGLGTALTAMIGVIAFKERLDWKKGLGLILIIAGVVVMRLSGGGH
ncbi:quaternary ammonium transporter [Paenibacillus agaridevorans]|uniref:Quaternary ammonium transporter n=1 Tax=Paenibacillus agaridevorans TaxID=171404 RepID=A0A2R5EY20_9BACL|nr:multidrug efflux SMR transporter [Paenibacillus agaridevorans]GBG11015.1 quaternary ammonium transporter [Paenibacillus agaridevorans]